MLFIFSPFLGDMGTHKISIRPACYGPYSMVAYEHVQQLGVKYLEINVPDNIELLRDMAQDEDLDFSIGSFIFPIETDDPKIEQKFREALETCSEFEYEYIFSSTKTKGKFLKRRKKGYKVLRKLGDIAEEYGTFISMETHPPFCKGADEMLETMENVDHPHVRVNFDTANIYYYNKIEEGEGIDELKRVIDYIGSLHIKQTNGKYKTWHFPNLGADTGIVDFKEVFSIMDDHGFDGIYTLEMEGTKEKPLKSLNMKEAKKEVEASIQHLKNIGVF